MFLESVSNSRSVSERGREWKGPGSKARMGSGKGRKGGKRDREEDRSRDRRKMTPKYVL